MIDHLIMWGAFAVVLGWPLVVCIAIWFPERAVLAAVLLGAGALTVWMMIAMRAEFVNDGFRMRMKMRKSAESAVLVQLDCGHPLKSAEIRSDARKYWQTLHEYLTVESAVRPQCGSRDALERPGKTELRYAP
jgi:hypothetical protein